MNLHPGDLVLALTDGVLEARAPDGREFGEHRTLEVLRAHRHRPAEAIAQALYEAVLSFCNRPHLKDDVTLVVVKDERTG